MFPETTNLFLGLKKTRDTRVMSINTNAVHWSEKIFHQVSCNFFTCYFALSRNFRI